MVQQLDDAVHRGARGLKILKDLGLGVRDQFRQSSSRGRSPPGPVWESCGPFFW